MTVLLSLCVPAGVTLVLIVLLLRHTTIRRRDDALLSAFRNRWHPSDSRGSHKVQTVMRDLTALGGDTLTVLILVCGALALAASGCGRDAALYGAIILSGRLAGVAMKKIVRRARPPLGHAYIRTFTSSFPSVHTLMSFINAFAIGHVMVFTSGSGGLALIPASGIAALVGATRLYFGVHWPSDVLAGWLTGFLIAAGFAILA